MIAILSHKRLEIDLLHEEARVVFKLRAEIGGCCGFTIQPLTPKQDRKTPAMGSEGEIGQSRRRKEKTFMAIRTGAAQATAGGAG
jgi:hypothetical protein